MGTYAERHAAGNAQSPFALVGISGWRYPPWRGVFYPRGLPQRAELDYAAQRLDSIELNGSFYSLQRPASFRRWSEQTPPDFVFAVKGPRYITHLLRLREADQALANFFASGVLALGRKLGPLLWQLPERHEFDAQQLDAFCAALPRSHEQAARLAARHDARLDGRAFVRAVIDAPIRHALEVRSRSFDSDRAFELLRRHGIALVVADTAGRWPQLREVTADFVYVRLHGAEDLYSSGYTGPALASWARQIEDWLDGSGCPDGIGRDVYVYFDNDVKVHAPFDAMALRRRIASAGRSVPGGRVRVEERPEGSLAEQHEPDEFDARR